MGLLVGKVLKIVGIKLGFIWPTLRAKFILRLYGCKYGNNLQVCGKVHFRPAESNAIALGNNVKLTARFLTNTVGIANPIVLECIKDGRIEIGDHSGLTSTIISARTLVRIGKCVKIGANVRIFDHDFHALEWEHRRDTFTDALYTKSAEIIIDDDVFIGTNTIILKGVHVGARSIISAGSVVSLRNIPPNSLVAGNPAQVSSSRLSTNF
jgi:acetyltransferase-like isoleucine patch superfamily enzyme